ncbi:MAG: serine hydrolase domain-containing protein, partial [Pseudomonadota bacterium]
MAKFSNQRIDNDAHAAMMNQRRAKIRCLAFHPGGGWVLITNSGIESENLPEECLNKLKQLEREGQSPSWVAFPPKGRNSWSIIHRDGFFNRNIPDECHRKMQELTRNGRTPRRVTFPPKRGNRWAILHDTGFFVRNIDDECFQIMRNRHQGPYRVHHVAFEPDGGWVVLAGRTLFARNVDDGCFNTMLEFNRENRLIDQVVFDTDQQGWSVISNQKNQARIFDPISRFESQVNGQSIWQEMRQRNIPGAAVAAVVGNQIAWSCGYGFIRRNTPHAVHPETVFQAASISKTLAALGIMRLINDGVFGLDTDIRDTLNQWTL